MSEKNLLPACICGATGHTTEERHHLPMLRCTSCGVLRQHVQLTPSELSDWYREHYLKDEYYHTYEHDLPVANKRLAAYNLSSRQTKLLDIGCGNGAFVTAARSRGIDAWGQDLSKDSESDFIYVGALVDIAFPSQAFDVITLHDVLEHFVDPVAALKEIRRLLRRPGKLIIDYPRFWHESGKHHWKAKEHLWMLTEGELVTMVEKAGFRVTGVSNPIPSKFVIEAERPAEVTPQILVPAGIGDAYWVLTKLPGFLKHHGLEHLGEPDVWVQDSGGPKRTQPYLANVPFINAPGYRHLPDRDPLFHEAYMQDRRTVFPHVLGVDYFIAYNGVMRAGRSLEDVDPQYGCDWRPRLHMSKAAVEMRDRMAGIGPYILTYWAEAGMYRHWLSEFSAEDICKALQRLSREMGARIVFMGSPWDRGQVGRKIADMDPAFSNLISGTTFDQMLGLILGAKAVVGYPAGNTILATALGKPTVLLWNRYFDNRFWTNACPPDANYTALDTFQLTEDKLVRAVQERAERA